MSKSTLFKSLTHSIALSKLFFKNFDFIKGAINHFYTIFLKSWRKSILLLLSVLTFGLLCEAQLFPGVLNQKCFGGTGFDEANKIISTNDGGFLFLGRYTANGVDGDIIPPGNSGSGDDYAWIVKLNDKWQIEWQNSFGAYSGGTNLNTFVARGAVQTADSGYIVFGDAPITYYYDNSSAWIAKYSKRGEQVWVYEYQKLTFPWVLTFNDAVLMDNGNIMVCGSQHNHQGNWGNAWLVEFSANGELIWDKTYSYISSTPNTFKTIKHDRNNTLIMAGSSNSDFYIVRTDTSGKVLLSKSFAGNYYDEVENISPQTDSTYMVAGNTTSSEGEITAKSASLDVYIMKMDKDCNKVWGKAFGGSKEDYVTNLFQQDSTFLITGSTNSYDFDVSGYHFNNADPSTHDIWLLKIKEDGKMIWSKCYGGVGDDLGGNAIVKKGSNDSTNIFLYGTAASNSDQMNGLHGYEGVPYGGSDMWLAELSYFNTFTGQIYIDKNNNGVHDAEEQYYTKGIIEVMHDFADSQFYRNETGAFTFNTAHGFYLATFLPQSPYYSVLNNGQGAYFSSDFNTQKINFRLSVNPGMKDIRISGFDVNSAKLATSTSYKIVVSNNGTDTIPPGFIKLVKDPHLYYPSSDSTPYYSFNDTIIWKYNSILPDSSIYYTVSFIVGSGFVLKVGDTLRSYLYAPLKNDIDSSNNESTITQIVKGAVDPNDKTEIHGGIISVQEAKDSYLNYVIRFQNTGTDTAITVKVKDTLDPKLDLSTFEMTGSSHNYKLYIEKGNILQWYFTPINLVDSNENEKASHAYISFRIKSTSAIHSGDIIPNRASVYFDYNLPVQTNINTTIVQDITLPLRLLSFSAQQKDKINLLKWSTVNEMNTDRFEIQRSNDSRSFSTIGTVRSFNNGKIKNDYMFTDVQPLKAMNYYRLRMIDKDGKFVYSEIRSINNTNIFDVKLYPNPVKDILRIEGLNTNANTISVINIQGKVMIKVTTLNAQYLLNVKSLLAGTYFVKIESENRVDKLKFIKE